MVTWGKNTSNGWARRSWGAGCSSPGTPGFSHRSPPSPLCQQWPRPPAAEPCSLLKLQLNYPNCKSPPLTSDGIYSAPCNTGTMVIGTLSRPTSPQEHGQFLPQSPSPQYKYLPKLTSRKEEEEEEERNTCCFENITMERDL